MATEIYDAVFQDGTFRPVRPVAVSLLEGQHVRLVVEVAEQNVLDLAGSVYEGLTDGEVTEIEKIALERREFFGKAAS